MKAPSHDSRVSPRTVPPPTWILLTQVSHCPEAFDGKTTGHKSHNTSPYFKSLSLKHTLNLSSEEHTGTRSSRATELPRYLSQESPIGIAKKGRQAQSFSSFSKETTSALIHHQPQLSIHLTFPKSSFGDTSCSQDQLLGAKHPRWQLPPHQHHPLQEEPHQI